MAQNLPSPIRPSIVHLEPNGIGRVAMLGLGDPSVIPLWFGESDLVTPGFICDAAKDALDKGRTFYTGARGVMPLREAIRDFHARTVKTDIAVERITVPGAAMLAVVTALQCVIETGDNVVCVSPVWPNIFQAAKMTGAEIKFARLEEEWDTSAPRWRLNLDKLFEGCDARTKAIFIASPGNPTGWVMSQEEQRAVLAFARERGIAIISDEVYGTLIYDGALHAPSFLQIAEADDAVFVINSFSKPWAMTGWRIGWLEAPPALGPTIENLIQYSTSGVPVPAQRGAVAALEEGEPFLADFLASLRASRDIVADGLAATGRVRFARPEAAFYLFGAVEGETDSRRLALRLVDEAGIGVAPGAAFGLGGEGYLRICFARAPDEMAEATRRFARWLAR